MKTLPAFWKTIKHFKPYGPDNFGDPYRISRLTVFTLDKFRDYVGKPIHVHCGYEKRKKGGWHPKGYAVDIHVEGMHVVDQYLAAERFDAFNGIGVYPNWHNPGLHLDTRPHDKTEFDARWGCWEPEDYVALDKEFLRECLK